ncbi:hypothetical protein [Naasia aerilata]|uniref:Uncharacterized protein n=1 Tax=Naasia aerilata TaxID=1162966 RepID=A0ABM8GGV5_9MICO|nr:hypothetical protein [Naasia aerilata]BDZ47578.1 hypothetical protein GCM10025866_34870 [Naasia aerilata]
MRIELPFPEAVALATAERPLPPLVTFLSASEESVLADIDLRELHPESFVLALAFAAAGTVAVTARFTGFAEGIATFAVTGHARGLPAHKVLPYVLGTVNAAIQRAGVPEGVVRVAEDAHEPVVRIDLQRAVETAVLGIRLTSFQLRGARIIVDAEVGTIQRVEPPAPAPAEATPEAEADRS